MAKRKDEAIRVLTADEVAKMLGLSRNSVYEAAGRGEIPCRRVGRRLLFSAEAIAAWLNDPNNERVWPAAGPRRRSK